LITIKRIGYEKVDFFLAGGFDVGHKYPFDGCNEHE
jgi:hypothetical protein